MSDKLFTKNIVHGFSILVLLTTGLFLLPILILIYVQFVNFISNRTTNERYSRKRYNKPKAKVEDDMSLSGTMSSRRPSVVADDIVRRMGAPNDYSHKRLQFIYNCYDMCCDKEIPD